MWLLVASLLVLRRGRAERSVTYAAILIAISMTLNIDQVYRTLDRLAGGTNLVSLTADLALMVGVFLLGRGVMKASEHHPQAARIALSRPALVVAFICAVIAFFLIDRGATATNFMLALGDQPAAATYNMIHFGYYGIVVVAMGALAVRQLRISRGLQLVPAASLLVGSVLGFVLCLVVYIMDVAHVTGNLGLMSIASVPYDSLYLLTIAFLCLGFASQPAVRLLQTRSRDRETRSLLYELEPLWTDATRVRPGISQIDQTAFRDAEPETLLHRRIVEIRDAMMDTRVSFAVSRRDQERVERAEHHLLSAESPGSARVGSPVGTRQRQHQR
jgi:hypothetical protein